MRIKAGAAHGELVFHASDGQSTNLIVKYCNALLYERFVDLIRHTAEDWCLTAVIEGRYSDLHPLPDPYSLMAQCVPSHYQIDRAKSGFGPADPWARGCWLYCPAGLISPGDIRDRPWRKARKSDKQPDQLGFRLECWRSATPEGALTVFDADGKPDLVYAITRCPLANLRDQLHLDTMAAIGSNCTVI